MKRLRRVLGGDTLVVLLLGVGVGWALWRTPLADLRTEAQQKGDTRWGQFIRAGWPPDGELGWGSPRSGSFGGAWRFKSYDWLFLLRDRLNPPKPPADALILTMDEQSHDVLHQSLSTPWDRNLHAQVLERCLTNGALAVVFDIIFSDMGRCSDLAADQALAKALTLGSNRVVIAYSTQPGEVGTRVPGIIPPAAIFREALLLPAREEVADNRYYAGLPEFEPDYDQRVRKHGPSYEPDLNSLAWSVAGLLQLPCLTTTNSPYPPPKTEERWLNYYGPGGFLNSLKYFQALNQVLTNASGEVADFGRAVSNKIVLIGSGTLSKASGERKDAYVSPLAALSSDTERFIAGVEIHGTAILNLLHREWLTRMNLRHELIIVLGVGLLCGFGFPRLKAWSMTTAAVLAALSITGLAYGLFLREHLWFGWLIPLTQIFLTWLVALVMNSARLLVQNRLYQQQLGLYLSPKLVKKFAHDKELLFSKPGAIKHELTIFFSDIAGFTSISEGLDSDELARTMNRYFQAAVGNCIFPTDGTVVKYIGDAIFAFWNAPDPQVDHAHRACDAALRFRAQAIIEVNGKPLITRIGLHSGVANVGNFGSTQRMDYTAIGENINLASRMEGLNKYLGTETLVSEATYTQVAQQFIFRPLGRFILKGFERAFEVYELCGALDQAPELAERQVAFANALAHFQAGRLSAARESFLALQTQWPQDGPTQFYVHTLDELVTQAPASGPWTGTIQLKEK